MTPTSMFMVIVLFPLLILLPPSSTALFWGGNCGCQSPPPPIPCVQPTPCAPVPVCPPPEPPPPPPEPIIEPCPPVYSGQSSYLPPPVSLAVKKESQFATFPSPVSVSVDEQRIPSKLSFIAPSSSPGTVGTLGGNNEITTEDIYDDAVEPLPILANPSTLSSRRPSQFTLTTEGYIPQSVLQRRHNLLKRYRAIVSGDVTESKRAVTRAAEAAYQGQQWDVICAVGEFSYTIHSRSYCEATTGTVTCFAFR